LILKLIGKCFSC